MNGQNQTKEPGCDGQCDNCSSAGDLQPPDDAIRGARFAWLSACAFLFPLIMAVAGAVIWKADRDQQAMAATVGLFAGFVIAYGLSKLVQKGLEEKK